MSVLKKIISLLIFSLFLIIVSIYGFDYKNFLANNYNSISLVLIKKDGLVEMNGVFANVEDAKKISDFLNINREGEYKYEENRIIDEDLLDELAILVTPLKDFLADNSKLSVIGNDIVLSGELKNVNYKDLLDSILSRVKIDFKTDITIPRDIVNKDLTESSKTESNLYSKEVQLSINNLLSTKKINFERRSSNITADSKIVLEEISKILKDNPSFKVEVVGHTDSRGRDSLNKKISQDRASSVRNVLITLGIDKDRIKAIGYGEEFPIAKDDENGLSEINRRVEFNILGE